LFIRRHWFGEITTVGRKRRKTYQVKLPIGELLVYQKTLVW